MWLNPLKGAHLTLGQLDKTLPVDLSVTDNDKIERGSIVFIKAGTTGQEAPRFQIYTATEAGKPNAVPYVALMGVKDFQAGMAGNVGQAPSEVVPGADGFGTRNKVEGSDTDYSAFVDATNIEDAQGFRGPRITAISLVQPAEWETDAYDKTVSTYYVGMPLTVAAGKLAPWATGKNIVGYVTAIPKKRWINDLGASADGARISGGYTKVIAFSTAWIPVAGKAAAGDSAPTAPVVGALSLKGGAKADAPADAGAKADAKDGAPAGAKVDNTKTK